MDLYLTSAEPGLTLQEMIEYDIKSGAFEDCIPEEAPSKITKMEFDPSPFDLDSVDITAMATLEDEFEFKPFEPIFDTLLPSFESDLMENKNTRAISPTVADTLGSWVNFSSMNNCNMDILDHGTIMVNPSAVLPSTMHGGSAGSIGRSAYLAVSSPSSTPAVDTNRNKVNASVTSSNVSLTTTSSSPNALYTIKKENGTVVSSQRQVPSVPSKLQQHAVSTQVIYNPVNSSTLSSTVPVLTTTLGLKPSSLSSSTQTNHRGTSTTTSPVITIPNSSLNTSNSTASVIYSNGTLHQTTMLGNTVSRVGTGTSPIYRTTSTATKAKTIPKYKRDRTPEERVFPKPAYSYSCLIALALKNSLTGSLPVSEIYSFMCEHFPYFRTAPNGWKNSVRHNLSLNKCFEKIEKPVVSGSNQRKGCLWALNPAKAHKMDEEVLKWSKKDLQGIKDAMPNPEVLENLERGEMKFEVTSSGASSCSEDEEEEETEPMSTESSELQPIKILNPLNAPIVLPQHGSTTTTRIVQPASGGGGGLRTLNQMKLASLQGAKTNLATLQGTKTNLTTRLNSSDNIGGTIHLRRSSSASQSPNRMISEDPDFILPHSNMSEINIQSNGAIVDDFGNEIKIEGELGVLNPSSSSNLILRKVNSPLRQSPIRSNFIYSTSPHHTGINRLVLANTKMSS